MVKSDFLLKAAVLGKAECWVETKTHSPSQTVHPLTQTSSSLRISLSLDAAAASLWWVLKHWPWCSVCIRRVIYYETWHCIKIFEPSHAKSHLEQRSVLWSLTRKQLDSFHWIINYGERHDKNRSREYWDKFLCQHLVERLFHTR